MRRPPLGASLATLAAIGLLCGLGTWQVQRLHWKTALLARLDHAYNDPRPPLLDAAAIDQIASGRNDFTAARLRGRFLPGRELQLGVRTWQEQAGYHAIAAFRLAGSDNIVLVDRGWVPAEKKLPAQRPESAPVQKIITITGLFHAPDASNPFVPGNQEDRDLWYRWDIGGMMKKLSPDFGYPHQDVVPSTIFYERDEEGAAALPVRAALHWAPPNDHLSYACFWFSMAGILAVMFFVRFMRAGKGSLPIVPDRLAP